MGPSLRSFQIQKDAQGNEIQVHISETPGLKAENLGLATWGSSYILANQLYRWKEDALKANERTITTQNHPNGNGAGEAERIPVLELGAGTSLVGISAAAVWGLPVIVTDLEPLMAGLEQNIAVNRELLQQVGAEVRCGTLDWTHPSRLQLHNFTSLIDTSRAKASILLAADTVYAEDHPTLLRDAIRTCLARTPEARVVLCYVLRHSYIEIIRELWGVLEGEVGLVCVEEGRVDAEPERWDDVAPFEWCVWRWRDLGEGEGVEG
ncbi:hypothetical protein M409DRAFT_68550 [Zasmidium cellare ATCC 36951]|uniref:Uncharacterized protein n=1 Tax=Zasmidium cellare ATCC 36951 TaxID=1080233 RepID=A0A6A6C802_ZASCE|nr:uncharacterized protein M409DRAFT_68550 [Zasmidium cellare ATCC 36951]KAF2163244.1 hypothetical protein M409DRAFT_68550 [Zasmidium cellare ATCC 36951]